MIENVPKKVCAGLKNTFYTAYWIKKTQCSRRQPTLICDGWVSELSGMGH